MEKTSLALRLARIALEIGSQIDSKCHKKLARKGHENRFRKPREWERKTMRMGMLRDENGNAKRRESLRIGTKKMPCFQRFTRSTGL